MTEILVVGIDPDIEASGVAVYDCSLRAFVLCTTMSLPDLAAWLSEVPVSDTLVVLEESSLSTKNWHISPRDSIYVAAAKGRSVGLCHATARHISEFCNKFGIGYIAKTPLKLNWKNGKASHEEVASILPGCPKKTNQEVRDAMLLAWNIVRR